MNNSPVLKVSDINKYIKTLFDYDDFLSNLRVEGEISNYKRHSSGHLYFSIKDNKSRINCVMFKGDTFTLKFEPSDGMKVVIEGYVSVFEKNGNYQLYVKGMSKKGVGELYEQYTALLQNLKEKGYFEESLKKAIPMFPKAVAVVTSPTGAAVRDIISVIRRRNKNIKVIVFPAKVQGEGSAEEVAQAIYDINRFSLADVIITGRGGGSIEELWAFNEFSVAQAIFDSEIPVVSAVGHETDFTIADFVSDRRAPTPSVAAEIVSFPIEDMKATIEAHDENLKKIVTRIIDSKRSELEFYAEHPILSEPAGYLKRLGVYLDDYSERLYISLKHTFSLYTQRLDHVEQLIKSLSADSVLARGYALIKKDDKVITGIENIKEEDSLDIVLSDGLIESKVEKIRSK